MFIAEVVETKKSYKPDQKDDRGNPLPLGSIEIRIGSHQSNIGQVRNVFARPAGFIKRTPLIGEQVLVFSGPSNDWSTSSNKGTGFYYISPINGTDDVVSHQFPKLWQRKGLAPTQGSGQRKSDKKEAGYTFPKSPKSLDRLQPFDGNDLIEGRFGASIRLGSTVMGDTSVYEKKPTWKGSDDSDPIMIFRVKSPKGSGKNYSIEDLKEDNSSIYLTSKQALNNLKGGFDKNTDVKQLGNWQTGGMMVADADRIVINAKKDMLFLIGATKAVVTGKKVLFQSDKYRVDLDDLMDFLKKWLDEDQKLSAGSAQYATPAGPTATATNMSAYLQLKTSDFQKFKMS